ncbi:hypothetical protein B0H14DRAFT_2572025 [Mycena olivaceomarginata]|nr:hypothetical protein B0H14DRAFT_2633422 [Mycena olivaceomarginata]KAJ7869178.1 hypothetical protein B0H14DRAFT_2572025 [Mycena olivaceomarginata]
MGDYGYWFSIDILVSRTAQSRSREETGPVLHVVRSNIGAKIRRSSFTSAFNSSDNLEEIEDIEYVPIRADCEVIAENSALKVIEDACFGRTARRVFPTVSGGLWGDLLRIKIHNLKEVEDAFVRLFRADCSGLTSKNVPTFPGLGDQASQWDAMGPSWDCSLFQGSAAHRKYMQASTGGWCTKEYQEHRSQAGWHPPGVGVH